MSTRVTQFGLEVLIPFNCDAVPNIDYRIEIDETDNTFQNIVFSATQAVLLSFRLQDLYFFATAWIRVTPIDALGDGISMTFYHNFVAPAPDTGVTVSVNPPPSLTNPGVPAIPDVQDNSTTYIDTVQKLYLD